LERQLITFGDFSGGLNVDVSPDQMAANELVVADNIDLGERGGAGKRYGTEFVNGASYASRMGQIFEWPRNDGSVILMGTTGNTLNRIANNGSITSLQALAKDRVSMFFLNDNLYFLDGQQYRSYDGSSVSTVSAHSDSENDLDPIRRCTFAVRHPKSLRMFFAGGSQDRAAVYYSEPNMPNFVKGTSKMYPTNADGPVTALAVFVDAVLVFFKNSIWVWRGVDPESDAIWHKLPTSEGTISPDTICLTTDSLTYLGNRGIFSLSPSIIGVNAEINPGRGMIVNVAKDKVESILKSITHPEKAVAEFYSKEGLYLLSYCDDGSGINNRILALDQQGAFVRWTGIQANDICHRLNGELLFASTNYLLRRKDWYRDALPSGQYVGIPAVMETPKYSLGHPMQRKLLTKYQAAIQGQLGNYEVTIKVKVDDQVAANTTLGSGLSKPLTLIRKQIRATGNRFSMELSNSQINMPFMVYGVGFEAKSVQSYGKRV